MGHILSVIEKGRIAKGLTSEEFYKKVGIHRSTLSKSNESSIKLGVLVKISKVLNIPITDFFEEEKADLTEEKKYRLAEELITLAGELVPEYKKLMKSLPAKTGKKGKK